MSDNIIRLDTRRKPPDSASDQPVCEVVVMEDGEVTLWLSDEVKDADQFNWLVTKITSALSVVIDVKSERTGAL